MKSRLLALLGLFALLLVWQNSRATHIVGAELFYECLDPTNSTYELTLKLYRDCQNGQAPYDPTITLFIFNGQTGSIFQTISVPIPPQTPQIQANFSNCFISPPQLCVEEGIYSTVITLPPSTQGYNIAWARCCRNQAIDNLSSPLNEGVTFLAQVPPSNLATCNSMPTFTQVPPIFLCSNELFAFDHSAIDPDGDSLSYALTDPYTGTNFSGLGAGNPNFGGNQPIVDPTTNPMGPPPYNNVIFLPGFNFLDPFGSGNFTIDAQTGFITVTPNQTGIFVFSISVFEWRNGQLLSENRRDFQIHVLNCLPQGAPPTITHDLTGLNFSGDTIFVDGGVPFCYDVTIQDPVPSDQVNGFTVSAAFGNGFFFPPPATLTGSGTNPFIGQVCWTPSCNYDGQTIPLVIGANDPEDCDNANVVFDTVWVVITVPPNAPPTITTDLTGLTTNGDTIFIPATNNFCFDFTVTDPNNGDILEAFPISAIFSDPNGPSFNITSNNPLTGQVCWEPDCNLEGQVIPLSIGAKDSSICNFGLPTQTTVYIKVEVPPNTPPGITTDLSGNVFSNDTIFVNALENLCFDFTAFDPDLGDQLSFIGVSPIFNGPNPPIVNTTGNNPLSGTICWIPDCSYENTVVELIFGAEDEGVCSNIGQIFDTVYISVAVPPNDGPGITYDLTGNVFSNDTIFVIANENLCFDFTANDPNAGDILSAIAISPIFNQANGPSFNFTPGNPLTGQICWTPDCNFVGQTVLLEFGVVDDADCSSQLGASDSVYINIVTPPNDPPTSVHIFNGLNTDGDTIFVDAQQAFCYDVVFSDINLGNNLTGSTVSPVFSGSNPATFTVIGNNPLTATICWEPECANEGQVIEFIVRAEDDGECNNILEVFDTVYVKVSDPVTAAPNVGSDLTGLNTVGNTIFIEIGDQVCYDFYIADNTPGNGVEYDWDFQTIGGTSLNLGSLTVTQQNDSILGTFCFLSDCSNGGSTYQVIITGTDKATCPPFDISRDTVNIKVNTSFQSYAGVDTSFCEGSGGVQLSVTPIGGTPGYFYSWGCNDPGNCGLSSPYVSNPIVNPTDTTTYFVQITDINGCTSEFDDVQVNVLRQPIVDAGPDETICEGGVGIGLEAVILNPQEAPGPYNFEWIPPTGLNNAFISSPFATPDTTTIYTVVVESANGCSSFNTTLDTLSTITVTVNERPVVEAGPDREICLGDTATLNGFANQAGPNYTYAWTPAAGIADSSFAVSKVSPPFTTTYFFVAWSNGCPSIADSTTVKVRTLPTADPGTVQEICYTDSVQLNGTASGDSTALFYTYQWSPAAGLNDPTSAMPWANPLSSTTYTLVATSDFGCESPPITVDVNVLPQPKVSAGPDVTICRGDTIQLNGQHSLGGGTFSPVFYEWSPATGLSGLFIPDPEANPQETILYTLKVSAGDCSATDDILVTVSNPVQAFGEADTNRICAGDSVQLTGSGGLGSSSYVWSPNRGLSNPLLASPMAAPDETTTYVLTVSEGACDAEAVVEVIVNPLPDADYLLSLDNGCAPLAVSFLENSQAGVNYIWDFGDGSPISNEANPDHLYTEPGTYTVSFTAIGEGGCQQTTADEQIVVSTPGIADFEADLILPDSLPLPNATVAFTNLSSNASSYYWDFGDGNVSTEFNPTHIYKNPGDFVVNLVITDAGGCVDSVQLGPLVIYEPGLLIPNLFTPNEDGINDQFRVTYDGREAFLMQIFDRWGRPVHEGRQLSWNGINLQGKPSVEGVYFYVIQIGEKVFRGDVTLLR
ncbi:MAG: PKD domain-containing protein [Bacteroidota bacterium]